MVSSLCLSPCPELLYLEAGWPKGSTELVWKPLSLGLSMTSPGQFSAALKTTGTAAGASVEGQQVLGLIALGDIWLDLNILRDAGWVLLTTVEHLQPPASGLQSSGLYFCWSGMSLSVPALYVREGQA